jgi:NAD-dependent deacetylase
MKKLVVLTGAGISAESGIRTFRDMGGLWEEYDVMEVASPEGFEANPELVLRFYNERRKQLSECKPNEGHLGLARLEKYFDVHIVTQNVDDLHERAGSSKILHLHGELKKVRSTGNENYVRELEGWQLNLGDLCPEGYQLRPHIVWFGEAVPEFTRAVEITRTADILAVIGTSLNVYPAAGLIDYTAAAVPVFLIDPNEVRTHRKVTFIREKASTGVVQLEKILMKEFC